MSGPKDRGVVPLTERVTDSRRIVVVGPCASGKSTLVRALQELGYDARVSGQEHSEIAHLWRRLAPNVLIALEVDVETVSERRGWEWPEWLHNVQRRRLAQAVASADLLIDTTGIDARTMVAQAVAYLNQGSST